MGTTPAIMVRGDEILVDDLFGLGGSQYRVLSNDKERGANYITLQLCYVNAITDESRYAELTVSIDSTFFVIRKRKSYLSR